MNLEDPRTRDRIFYALVIACVLTVVADLFYNKYGVFEFESWFGFTAVFGFFACVALILLSKQLRKLVKRDEDYYDR